MENVKLLCVVVLLALAVLTLHFVVNGRENLHDADYTSFAIATFEQYPTIDERLEFKEYPLIFRAPYAVPLRAVLTSILLLFLFFPSLAGLLCGFGKLSVRWYILGIVFLWMVTIVIRYIPEQIISELYSSLAFLSQFYGLSLTLASIITVWFWKRAEVRYLMNDEMAQRIDPV